MFLFSYHIMNIFNTALQHSTRLTNPDVHRPTAEHIKTFIRHRWEACPYPSTSLHPSVVNFSRIMCFRYCTWTLRCNIGAFIGKLYRGKEGDVIPCSGRALISVAWSSLIYTPSKWAECEPNLLFSRLIAARFGPLHHRWHWRLALRTNVEGKQEGRIKFPQPGTWTTR